MDTIEVLKAYKGKKVLITGHTGFKGSWMSLWLAKAGAHVYGYSLPPPGSPSLFDLLQLEKKIDHQLSDIRDFTNLSKAIVRVKPDVIFHLAAQSLVGEGYMSPLETMQVNTIGTANVLEAVRRSGFAVAIVIVTSDKCYRNNEWLYGYRETDPLGGDDPYSASKGAAEIMVHSWRNSFFHPARIREHGVRVASVRAGNVIGGGDYAENRIVPDCVRFLEAGDPIIVRNPLHTRPWQHVLEPLSGYLTLGEKLMSSAPAEYCEAFNFGPNVNSNRNVRDLVEQVIEYWGEGTWRHITNENAVHETSLLHVSSDKAFHKLQWQPQWNFEETIATTVEWYKHASSVDDATRLTDFTLDQITRYEEGKRQLIANNE